MELDINIVIENLSQHEQKSLEDLIESSFYQINAGIKKVEVSLCNLREGAGDANTMCSVFIVGLNGSTVFLKDVQNDKFEAVERAISRAIYAYMSKRKRAHAMQQRRREAMSIVHKQNIPSDSSEVYLDKPIHVEKK